jgi:hypothetical protein
MAALHLKEKGISSDRGAAGVRLICRRAGHTIATEAGTRGDMMGLLATRTAADGKSSDQGRRGGAGEPKHAAAD